MLIKAQDTRKREIKKLERERGEGKSFVQMSQDSQEIKTIEQWRWSEMQGLELLSPSSTSASNPDLNTSYNSDPFHHRTPKPIPEGTEMEENSNKNTGGVPTTNTASSNTTSSSNSNSNSNPSSSSADPRKDNEEKPKDVPAVAFSELFRFADGLDYVLMGIGTAGAIVHGCSLPLFLRFFADLVNSFGSNANNMDKMMQEVLKVNKFDILITKFFAFKCISSFWCFLKVVCF